MSDRWYGLILGKDTKIEQNVSGDVSGELIDESLSGDVSGENISGEITE